MENRLSKEFLTVLRNYIAPGNSSICCNKFSIYGEKIWNVLCYTTTAYCVMNLFVRITAQFINFHWYAYMACLFAWRNKWWNCTYFPNWFPIAVCESEMVSLFSHPPPILTPSGQGIPSCCVSSAFDTEDLPSFFSNSFSCVSSWSLLFGVESVILDAKNAGKSDFDHYL